MASEWEQEGGCAGKGKQMGWGEGSGGCFLSCHTTNYGVTRLKPVRGIAFPSSSDHGEAAEPRKARAALRRGWSWGCCCHSSLQIWLCTNWPQGWTCLQQRVRLNRESSMLGPSSPAGLRNMASSGTLSSVFLLIFRHTLVTLMKLITLII